jgi:hypothetical protein
MALLSCYSSLADNSSSSSNTDSISIASNSPRDTPVKLCTQSNGRIKSYSHFESLLKLGRQDLLVAA